MTSKRMGALVLPGDYGFLLSEKILSMEFASPPEADCLDCPEAKLGLRHPVAKCCQYMPSIPNFAVGEALSEKSEPESSVFQGIMGRGRASPLFLSIPAPKGDPNARKWGHAALPEWFVCPFVNEKGMCLSYDHRGHVCATYICPASGKEMCFKWVVLRSLVDLVEATTARFLAETNFKGRADWNFYFACHETLICLGKKARERIAEYRASEILRRYDSRIGIGERLDLFMDGPLFSSRNPFDLHEMEELVVSAWSD